DPALGHGDHQRAATEAKLAVNDNDVILFGTVLGHDVVARDAQVHRAGVDFVEDVARTLEDNFRRPARQTAHACSILTWVAAINAQAALRKEALRVFLPAFRRQRQAQGAHASALRIASATWARATRVSWRERISRSRTTSAWRSSSPMMA